MAILFNSKWDSYSDWSAEIRKLMPDLQVFKYPDVKSPESIEMAHLLLNKIATARPADPAGRFTIRPGDVPLYATVRSGSKAEVQRGHRNVRSWG